MIIEIALGIVLGILLLYFIPQILVIAVFLLCALFAIALLGGGVYALYYGIANFSNEILQITIITASIASICFAINYISTAYVQRKINLGIYQTSAEASKVIGEKIGVGFIWIIFYMPVALVFSVIIMAFVYKTLFML